MSTPPSQAANAGGSKNLAEEAARYALLRHLAPAIRHHVAGALQPVSMMAALLHKRLKAAVPAASPVLMQSAGDINTLSREATASCLQLMSWIQPNGRQSVTLQTALEEAMSMVKTELAFRGFQIVNETADIDIEVTHGMSCTLFLASLIALTSAAQAPANVRLTAHVLAQVLVMKLEIEGAEHPLTTAGGSPSEGAQTYRPLDRDDVKALADAEGVGVDWYPNRVDLRFNLQARESIQG